VGYSARITVCDQAAEESRRIMGKCPQGQVKYRDDADNRPLSLHPMVVPEPSSNSDPSINTFSPSTEELFDGELPDLTSDEDAPSKHLTLVKARHLTEALRLHKRAHDQQRESEERQLSQKVAKRKRQKAHRAASRAAAQPENYTLNPSFVKKAPAVPAQVHIPIDARGTLKVSQNAFTASRSKTPGLPKLLSLTKEDLVERYNFLYVDWDGV
jgi:hypothetical protein